MKTVSPARAELIASLASHPDALRRVSLNAELLEELQSGVPEVFADAEKAGLSAADAAGEFIVDTRGGKTVVTEFDSEDEANAEFFGSALPESSSGRADVASEEKPRKWWQLWRS